MAWSAENLISWETVQALMGTTYATVQAQPQWDFLVGVASTYAQKYCNRNFLSQSYTLFTTPAPAVVLPNGPVSEVEVYYDPSRVWGVNSLLSDDYYSVSRFDILQFDSLLPNVNNSLKVVYTGGYEVIPADLQMAIFEYASWMYVRVQTKTIGQKLSGQDGYNLPLAFENPPYNVVNILNTYRSPVL